jgi:hypothetical protein
MNKSILKFVSASVLSMFFLSCEKAEVDTETQSAEDNTIAESAFAEVFPVVNSIGIQEEGVNKTGSINGSCASYTVIGNTTHFPDSGAVTIIIDYGPQGCLDFDGKYRKGKLHATFNNKWNLAGSKVDIVLDNFQVNNVKFSGTVISTNNGNNSYTNSVVDGKCWNNDWSIFYASSHTIEQIGGMNTDTIATDDVFRYSGSSNGKNRNGKLYTTNITTPLIKKSNCKWIDTGVYEITPEGLATRIVNFGNGTCDNDATVTINGNVYEFKLN